MIYARPPMHTAARPRRRLLVPCGDLRLNLILIYRINLTHTIQPTGAAHETLVCAHRVGRTKRRLSYLLALIQNLNHVRTLLLSWTEPAPADASSSIASAGGGGAGGGDRGGGESMGERRRAITLNIPAEVTPMRGVPRRRRRLMARRRRPIFSSAPRARQGRARRQGPEGASRRTR